MKISMKHRRRASDAVILFFGSMVSIFTIRSLAPLDIVGQGALSKSISPFKMASNIPRSVSRNSRIEEPKGRTWTIALWSNKVELRVFRFYQPKKEEHHWEGYTKSHPHSIHRSPSRNVALELQEQCSKHFQPCLCTLFLDRDQAKGNKHRFDDI